LLRAGALPRAAASTCAHVRATVARTLPLTAGIVTASTTANIVLLPRTGPRPLLPLGMALGAIGMFLLTRITPTSGYASTHTGDGAAVLAAVHGYTTAFTVSGCIFVAGAILTAVRLPSGVLTAQAPQEPVAAH